MTTRPMIPLDRTQHRLPEIGRLKLGVKTDRAMKSITEWRFLSNDRDALADIAGLYGGEVRDYKDPKSDWTAEVLSTSAVIDVRLPVIGDGETANLCAERWGGGGLEVRCSGTEDPEAMMRWIKGPGGAEQAYGPCECLAKGTMTCDPKLRVNFFLKGVRGFGVWRLETSSSNAIAEMRGLVEMLRQVQADGILEFQLALDPRHKVRAGETRRYVVPVVKVPHTMEALASGQARMAGTLGAAAAAEIGPGPAAVTEAPALAAESAPVAPDPDDEVIEAEIVGGEAPSTGAAWDEWRTQRGLSKTDVLRTAAELADGEGPGTLAKLAEDPALSARVMGALS